MFEDSFSEPTHDGRSAVVSLIIHAGFVLLLFLVGVPVTRLASPSHNTTLLAPLPTPVKSLKTPPKLPVPQPKLRAALPPPVTPRLTLPKIEIAPAPQIETPRQIAMPVPEQPHAIPAPAPVIKTGEFAQATPSSPKVIPQTAIEPSGFQAAGNAPSILARGKLSSPVAGFDVESGGRKGAQPRGISQSGFGETAAASTPSGSRAVVTKSSFGDTTVAAAPAAKQASFAALTNGVEILAKPRPLYTSEARTQGIEGEVLIEVVFEASGTMRILRVVKGLGHGLDESAQAAAKNIQFRPARRDGAAVDSTAIVHIVFQLAY